MKTGSSSPAPIFESQAIRIDLFDLPYTEGVRSTMGLKLSGPASLVEFPNKKTLLSCQRRQGKTRIRPGSHFNSTVWNVRHAPDWYWEILDDLLKD